MTNQTTDTRALIAELVEALEKLAIALPIDKSTVKTCYAINDIHRDSIHSALTKARAALAQTQGEAEFKVQQCADSDSPWLVCETCNAAGKCKIAACGSECAAAYLPMDTAPTNGTMVRLLVDFEGNSLEDTDQPVWTVGACYASDSEGDVWQFAGWNWSQDCFTEGHGKPIGWLPMLDATYPQASEPAPSPKALSSNPAVKHSESASLSSEPAPSTAGELCPVCQGSGERTYSEGSGPDLYDVTTGCDECDGSGDLLHAYEKSVNQREALQSQIIALRAKLFAAKAPSTRPATREEKIVRHGVYEVKK